MINPYEPRTAAEARDLVLWLAFREMGLSDAAPYWRSVGVWTPEHGLVRSPPYPRHWCGAFALAMLHAAGLTDVPWYIHPDAGRWGFCWRLPTTTRPKPADIAYFKRAQHHAIWVGDGTGRLINGNGRDGEVSVSNVANHEPDAYYAIAPFLQRFDEAA